MNKIIEDNTLFDRTVMGEASQGFVCRETPPERRNHETRRTLVLEDERRVFRE